MDDLDHSMCIADHDWKSFFEETEECWLLQPLLACPDKWSLSDSEDTGDLSVSLGTDRLELCQNEGGESDTVGCRTEDGEISQSRSGGERDNLTAKAKGEEGGRRAKPATCCDITAPCAEAVCTKAVEHVLQVTSVPGTSRTEQQNAPSPEGEATELKKGDGDTQKEGITLSLEEADPLSFKPRELSAGSAVASRTEKERWFITVSDGPPRQPARTKAAKTKMRQRKTCRKENKLRSWSKKKACECGSEVQAEEISAGRRGYGGGAVQITPALDNMSTTDVDCQDPSGPLSSTGSSELGSETGDSLEFVSAHSWDSDSYLSAEEEYQEARHLPASTPLRKSTTCDSMVYPTGDTVPDNCESTDAALAPPSAGQSADNSPNESSDRDAGEGCMVAETPGHQAHGSIHPPATLSIPGDKCGLPNVPGVTLTPCTVADSPETYAAAAGHHRSVYAISAFWDEMEKLTINDILQLRMGRGSPPAAASPHVDDLAESHGSAVDPAELSLPDAGLMDGSDNADSDYFTQPDDSKPDRSSCEFSASDFEEEYWQFLGTSRNPSPDPQTSEIHNSPCTGREEEEEEEESTGSEGRDTPVPPDSSANWSFEHQEAFTSDNPLDQRPISKSKSTRNIQALNTLDLCLDLKDESSLFLCSCLSLEEEPIVAAGDGLETQLSSPFAPDTVAGNDWTQISVLEVPECYYTKDVGIDSRSVNVYNPEDISPLSALEHSFLYTLCSAPTSKEKPVPIFSYSHSTIRELTFPNYISLNTDPRGDTIFLFTDTRDMRDIVRGLSSEAPRWFHNWSSPLPMRKTHFHGKGSIWWKGSGARLFPVEDPELCTDKGDLRIPRTDPKSIPPTCPQTCRDLAVQQRISDPFKMSM